MSNLKGRKVVTAQSRVRLPFTREAALVFLSRVAQIVDSFHRRPLSNPQTQYTQRVKTGEVHVSIGGKSYTVALAGFIPAYRVVAGVNHPTIAKTQYGDIAGETDKGAASYVLQGYARGAVPESVNLTVECLAIVAYAALGVQTGRGFNSSERQLMAMVLGAAEDTLGAVVDQTRDVATRLRATRLALESNGVFPNVDERITATRRAW